MSNLYFHYLGKVSLFSNNVRWMKQWGVLKFWEGTRIIHVPPYQKRSGPEIRMVMVTCTRPTEQQWSLLGPPTLQDAFLTYPLSQDFPTHKEQGRGPGFPHWVLSSAPLPSKKPLKTHTFQPSDLCSDSDKHSGWSTLHWNWFSRIFFCKFLFQS